MAGLCTCVGLCTCLIVSTAAACVGCRAALQNAKEVKYLPEKM